MRSFFAVVVSALTLSAAFVACGGATQGGNGGGGTGGGTGSVSGSVSDTSFTVASAFAAFQSASSGTNCSIGPDGGSECASSSSGQAVIVALTNKSAASCETLVVDITSKAEPSFANLDALALVVANQTGDLTPGTYPVVTAGANPNSGSIAELQTTTSTCAVGLSQQSTGGSVTLTKVSATEVAGSYQVTFGSEGAYSGSFDVEVCALPDGGLSNKVTSTGCTP